ncbi:hypothetical protein [Aliarcobacter butzleri]|uniref:Uncharacterized protein n=1 Tax=Aliarcobacter butzleri TaxID=28197 RepID=A0AAP4Q2Y9_9BACT|nr:hypothetical protein [Aliarcobacter butzleri]MCG3707355.1 hypothetical protein [Aliarcobacter butzleri]MDN5053258.1 hypothetical protein [Aliarcobacter butzleri]MDN5076485.1 hypothetical protein [Aliarcobacter butzleri]MDN5117695.1 hypothetical protein [Aliarcobacter butzleri]MDN5133499.1 hypothetical protein [Aliarcobacter butzleri]
MIGTAFIGCSSTPNEITVKSLALVYNIKSAQESDIKIVKSFEKDGKIAYILQIKGMICEMLLVSNVVANKVLVKKH